MTMILEAAGLAIATLLSEDLACVSAGLLVQRGEISLPTAITGCAVGIFAGDCGLWALGRGADRMAKVWPKIDRLRASAPVRTMRHEIVANAPLSILASRFLPGARAPLYVAAGALGLPGARFATWAGLATLIWTPSVVFATVHLSDLAERIETTRVWGPAAAAVGLLLAMRSIHRLTASNWSRVASWLSCRRRQMKANAAHLRDSSRQLRPTSHV